MLLLYVHVYVHVLFWFAYYFFSHIQYDSHYLLSFSCNVLINEFKEKKANGHEYAKMIHPPSLVKFSSICIRANSLCISLTT